MEKEIGIRNGEFATIRGDIIRYSLFAADKIGSKPMIILTHGFKGFKDWGFFPPAAFRLAEAGFPVLTFNFSHNGIGDDLLNFNELEKFAENTFSLEKQELGEVIERYNKGYFGEICGRGIILHGHSRGGVSAILNAKSDNVLGLILWAAISKLDRYSERQKQQWRKTGQFKVKNARTGQEMKINISLLEDIENFQKTSLNLESALAGLNIPVLIVHGEEDVAVPVSEGFQLHSFLRQNTACMKVIKQTGHTFGIVHPFDGATPQFDEVMQLTMNFVNSI